MAAPSLTYTLTNGTTADADQVMQNFNDLLNGYTDGTKDLTLNALTVNGTAVLNGSSTTIGNASSDDLTVTASLASSVAVKTANTFDFGGATSAMRSFYLADAGSAARATRLLGGTVASSWTLTTPTSAGTDKYVLKTDGSGVTSWVPTARSSDLINYGITASVGSNILTVALKDAGGSNASTTSPIDLTMRSATATTGTWNVRQVTAALSQTLTAQSGLGQAITVSSSVWVYLVDSDGAGTMKLALSGTLKDQHTLQTTVAESATATITNASPGVATTVAHGLQNGNCIRWTTTGGLPTGLSVNTNYWIINRAADTFQMAATPGGAAINTSSAGSGAHTWHAADSNLLVSDAAYVSKPVRVLGRITISHATVGLWDTAPTEISTNTGDFVETIHARYLNTAGTVLTKSTTNIVPFPTLDVDSHNIMQADAGAAGGSALAQMVVPVSGRYQIYANGLGDTGATWAAADFFQIRIAKNATATTISSNIQTVAHTTFTGGQGISDVLNLSALDRITITMNPNKAAAGNQSLATSSGMNFFALVRIGP